ncbi:MAG: hypothetical protein ACM31C_34615 [Acidobacteriota bacterium]
MGRAALALVLVASAAHASPPLALQLGLGGGEQWAERSGWLRDDDYLLVRAATGLGDFVALDLELQEDLDRVEATFGAGVRVRPWAGACWRARWSPYVRAELAVAGASHLGSNYDLVAGAGHWGAITSHARWLHWFAEVDLVTRVGEYTSVSPRLELGLAVATASFWR